LTQINGSMRLLRFAAASLEGLPRDRMPAPVDTVETNYNSLIKDKAGPLIIESGVSPTSLTVLAWGPHLVSSETSEIDRNRSCVFAAATEPITASEAGWPMNLAATD
jgi:hypothetical protein